MYVCMHFQGGRVKFCNNILCNKFIDVSGHFTPLASSNVFCGSHYPLQSKKLLKIPAKNNYWYSLQVKLKLQNALTHIFS